MNSLVRYLDGNKADDVLNPRSRLLQINVFSTDSIKQVKSTRDFSHEVN